MLDLSLELFRVFFQVAKSNSISRAAEALYLTQPAVSSSVKRLEKWAGCLLFIRTPRGVELTAEGEMLYRYVKQAINILGEAEMILRSDDGELTGSIEIGATETAIYHFLLPILSDFRKAYPKIKIKISGSATGDVLSSLKRGTVDIAFVVSPVEDSSAFNITEIKELNDVFIANNSFSELKDRVVPISQLIKYPIACVDKSTSAGRFLEKWFDSKGYPLKPQFSVRTSTLVLPFVLNGLCIGVVPTGFIQQFLDEGTIFQIKSKESLPSRKLLLVTYDTHPQGVVYNTFVKFIKERI